MKVNFLTNNANILTYKSTKTDLHSDYLPAKITPPIQDTFVKKATNPIEEARKILAGLRFDTKEVEKVKQYVSLLSFKDGAEAVNYAVKENIAIIFDKVSKDDIHAQWQNHRRTIVINEKYRNTQNPAEIYAISAAILHELAHAKDSDCQSSVQEEIDALAMNALAFSAIKRIYPDALKASDAPILNDGVALYSDLFFKEDKSKLAKRIKLKYGNLPLESPNHKARDFAKEIKSA